MDTANTNVIGLGRPHARHRRGRRPAGRADLRARHDRPLRPRRHAAQRLHRPPEGRPGDRRRCTPSPTTGRSRTSSTSSIGADGLVRQVEPIEVDGGPMVHDCSITERWMVVYDLPVTFDLDARDERRRASRTPGTRPTASRSGSCPSAAGGATSAGSRSSPCYVFHPLNAYDDGDRVVLDVVRYRQMFDRQPARPRRGAAAAVALDARPGDRARSTRSSCSRRAARVPAGRRARSSAAATASAGPRSVRRVDGPQTTSAAGSCASTARPATPRRSTSGRPARRGVGDGAPRRRTPPRTTAGC